MTLLARVFSSDLSACPTCGGRLRLVAALTDPDLHILWVVRDREFKYIYFADPEFPPILFDLRSDPDELNNVAGLAEYAAIELSCCHKLLRWRMYNEDQRMEHWAQPLREAD